MSRLPTPSPRRAAPLLFAAVLAAPAAAAQDGRPSLQDVLRELRERRDAALEVVEPRVREAVARLEELGARQPTGAHQGVVDELRAMADVAVPLLVEHLDPGESPGAGARFRAQEVARLLETVPTLCVLEQLVELVERGSPEGRVHAVHVLGTVDAPERVGPELERVLTSAERPELRAAALRALARLGGERSEQLLRRTLVDARGELLRSALEALTAGRVAAAAPEVLAVARDPQRGSDVSVALADYFLACPETLDEEVALALLRLVEGRRPTQGERLAVLRRLRRAELPSTSDVRAVLRDIASAAAGSKVGDAALVSLVHLGDARARPDLLDAYDQRVDQNPAWAQAYEERGTIYMRLGEYDRAQRDFREALSLLRDKHQATSHVWLLVARCAALDGELKDAADALRDAALRSGELLALRDDPDFAELAAHPRYGKVFPAAER